MSKGAAKEQLVLLDQPVWNGIQTLLDAYLGIEAVDDVVIAYTTDSRNAAVWVALALKERGLAADLVPMAPLKDKGIHKALRAVIPKRRNGTGRCILMLFERDTMSHNNIVRLIFAKYRLDQYQVLRAINSGADLFATGLSLRPEELSAVNTAVLERCLNARSLVVRTDAGTNLNITLDSAKYRWISNRGMMQPGKFLVIPAGEVATFPENTSGTLVADFAMNVNTFFEKDVRLDKCPVTIEIEDGVAIDYHCPNPEILDYLDRNFRRENAKRVGELGIGTHRNIKTPVPENSHLNERCPGVHIGFGQHNQTVETAGYFCDVHIDLIAKGGRIWVDDEDVPIDLAHVNPSANPHPEIQNSEDVFSPDDLTDDCCGIFT